MSGQRGLSRRGALFGAAGLGVLGAAGGAGWAAAVEPRRLTLRRYRLASPSWPAGHGPLRVGFVTDLHVGCLHVGTAEVARAMALLAAQRPDLVLFGGDFVVGGSPGAAYVPADEFAPLLAAIEAPLGRWAVLGNHDWWRDGPAVGRALERAGIGVLENQAVRLGTPGRRLWLAGLADDTTREPDVPGTLAQAGGGERAPVIALAHDPATFLDMPPGPVVTLCGHTHGGQVRLPLYGPVKIPGRAPLRYAYGRVTEGGRDLLVSGGVGESVLPIRFGVPPEVVILDVEAAIAPAPAA